MKYELCNGSCEMRFMCKNVNKPECRSVPIEETEFVECSIFEKR